MPHRIALISEVLLGSMTLIIATASRMMLAMVPDSEIDLYRWTLLPIIGAVLSTIGAFCFNTEIEIRKIVVGRCTFAFAIGVIGPRMVFVFSPWENVRNLLIDPLLLIGAGALFAFCAYILSYPFARKAYQRAPYIAAQKIREIELAAKMKAESPTEKIEP